MRGAFLNDENKGDIVIYQSERDVYKRQVVLESTSNLSPFFNAEIFLSK